MQTRSPLYLALALVPSQDAAAGAAASNVVGGGATARIAHSR